MSRSVALLLGLLVAAPAGAQEDLPCEARAPGAARELAVRLGLDADQEAWLRDALAGGGIRSPEDLAGLPGAGSELLEGVEDALCWDPPARLRASAAARTAADGVRREGRISVQRDLTGGDFRIRRDCEGTRIRGAVRSGLGPWILQAGTLRTRAAGGLLLATPGAAVRGDAPVRFAAAGTWQGATSLVPEVPLGVALRHESPRGAWEGALLMDRFDGAASGGVWGALTVRRHLGRHLLGAGVVPLRGRTSLQVWWLLDAGPGSLGVETAVAGGAVAGAFTWSLRLGPVRWRGSAIRSAAGYRHAPGLHASRAFEDRVVEVRSEALWRDARGTFLRGGLSAERAPERAGEGWPRQRRRLELETGGRPARGAAWSLLWRFTAAEALGEEAGAARDEVVRCDVSRTRRGWRLAGRLELRTEDRLRTRLLLVRLGRPGGRIAWDAGMAAVGGDARGPGAFTYRRRAGQQYGWDRLSPGTWFGGWVRLPVGAADLEFSTAARSAGWEGAAAVIFRNT